MGLESILNNLPFIRRENTVELVENSTTLFEKGKFSKPGIEKLSAILGNQPLKNNKNLVLYDIFGGHEREFNLVLQRDNFNTISMACLMLKNNKPIDPGHPEPIRADGISELEIENTRGTNFLSYTYSDADKPGQSITKRFRISNFSSRSSEL